MFFAANLEISWATEKKKQIQMLVKQSYLANQRPTVSGQGEM